MQIFTSRESLINWAREVGRRNGFIVVIKTSAAPNKRNKKPRLTLGCERSGTYRETRITKDGTGGKKMKQTGSKKCGCPFTLQGKVVGSDDEWMLHIVCGVHNHPAADFLEGHSFAGRLTKEETSLLVDMSKNMVRPKDILVTLKHKNELNVSTMKTIYNARQRQRVAERAGRSQMQQLLKLLAEHGYIEWHRNCPVTDTVIDLFFTHPTSLDLLRAFPHVLIMDCTYKTNLY